MQDTNKQYIYIDLFSGCGGLALGMHQAGWKALFAVEKNEDAFKTLRHNLIDRNAHFEWPEWLPIQVQDINTMLVEHKKELIALRGKVKLIAGGPPCQGFSFAGRRQENDIRNTLVDSYLRFVDLVCPESLLFENVKGFTQAFQTNAEEDAGKNYAVYILDELKQRGYNVKAEMLNFSNFGVPQRRVRFILFASKTISPITFFETLNKNVKPFLNEKNLSRRVSIKSALSDLERCNGEAQCPDSKGFMSGRYGNVKTKYQRFCRQGARKGKVPDSHRFARHSEETINRFQELLNTENIRSKNISRLLKTQYGIKKNCFSVLDPKIPAPTLTSNPDDHLHYCEPRTLTVREYARIQSFPDWYEFQGRYTTGGKSRKLDVPRYTQIGNAIPPLFAEQVGRALIQLMDRDIGSEV
ncbi:MAG: DNA cytosine methyltransferase [Bacteroides sp.]|nr:DNA cytosine methyltransferase [Bacteroides sp.]